MQQKIGGKKSTRANKTTDQETIHPIKEQRKHQSKEKKQKQQNETKNKHPNKRQQKIWGAKQQQTMRERNLEDALQALAMQQSVGIPDSGEHN
jgi:hypothetical protein